MVRHKNFIRNTEGYRHNTTSYVQTMYRRIKSLSLSHAAIQPTLAIHVCVVNIHVVDLRALLNPDLLDSMYTYMQIQCTEFDQAAVAV